MRPLTSSRAVVVLGGKVSAKGAPEAILEARLQTTLDCAQRTPDAWVIVSGGAVGSDHKQAEVMARWLTDRGLDPDRIVVEDQSRTTLENVENVAPMLRALGVDQIDLVTSRFHMARARTLLHGALDAFEVHAQVTPRRAPDPFPASERASRLAHEGVAIVLEGVNQRLLHSGRQKLFNGHADREAGGRPRIDLRAISRTGAK